MFVNDIIQNKLIRYRITRIQVDNQTDPLINRKYTYDYNGNIVAVKQDTGDTLPKPEVYAGSDTYSYVTGSDRIDSITGRQDLTYSYDGQGNIISDGIRTFTYNQAGRLVTVDMGVLTKFVYNAKSQRVKKNADGVITVFHYDLQGNLISETGDSGNLIANYVYAGSERIAKVDSQGNVYYYHNDHLGTPIAMTDDSGNKVWQAYYYFDSLKYLQLSDFEVKFFPSVHNRR